MEAKILITGHAIRSTGMSDFRYTKYGSIQGFTINSIQYRYCVDKVAPGYYDFNKYLDFKAGNSNVIPLDFKPFTFTSAETGDTLRIYQRNISSDFLQVCWLTYEFPHVTGKSYGDYEKIQPPINTVPIPDPQSCTHNFQAAKSFYDHFINKAITANDSDFAEIIADIEQLIESIESNIFIKLNNDPQYQPYILNQTALWSDSVTYNFETKNEYSLYYSSLSSFALYFQTYQRKIGNDSTLVFIYLASVMPYEAIEDLPLSIKKDMLIRLADHRIYNWQLFYNPVEDQSVIVTIAQSINSADADDFLDFMIDSKHNYSTFSSNLFLNFYEGLNNTHFGIGKSNFHGFVFTMYQIWRKSSYNPYQNEVFNLSNFQKYTYNNLVATSPNNDGFWDTIGLSYRELNFNAAPITLNYTSSKFIGIYFDNFKFYADFDSTDFRYDMRFFANSEEMPRGKICAVVDNYMDSGGKGLYGTYDYYQPVALFDSNQQAIMKIPVIDASNPATIDGQKINSLIPIFFLKYIDDAGDESDLNTSIGYFIDILSLFVGGYGLLEKIKYIRTLSGFTEAIVEGSEIGTQTILTLYGSAAINGINFSAATVSFLFKLSGDTYKNEPWYKNLVNTLTWIEMLSASGSVLSDKLLKTSTKNLVDDFNSLPNGWPEDFVNDQRGLAARTTLGEISGVFVNVRGQLFTNYQLEVNNIITKLLAKEDPIKFPKFGADGLPLHTAEELSQMMTVAYDGKLPTNEIAELIHISYKSSNRIASAQLTLQIKYYINVTKEIGFPAGIQSIEDYIGYCNDINNYWEEAFQDLSNSYKVNLNSISYDLKIQGSALRKRLPTDPPPPVGVSLSDYNGLLAPNDTEYVMLMDETNFDSFINDFETIIKKSINDTKIKNELKKGISYARKKGSFSSRYFKYLEHNNNIILDEMRSSCSSHLTGLSSDKINFSITKKGTRLDLGPYLDFKYNP